MRKTEELRWKECPVDCRGLHLVKIRAGVAQAFAVQHSQGKDPAVPNMTKSKGKSHEM